MTDTTENEFNQLLCDEKHKGINIKIESVEKEVIRVDKKVDSEEIERIDNISTAKESLNSRLDEINKALRGDKNNTGAFEDIRLIKQNLENYVKKVSLYFKIILILMAILIGGRIFGVNINTIKEYFNNDGPTPIVQPITVDEVPETIPPHILKLIDDKIEESRIKNKNTFIIPAAVEEVVEEKIVEKEVIEEKIIEEVIIINPEPIEEIHE